MYSTTLPFLLIISLWLAATSGFMPVLNTYRTTSVVSSTPSLMMAGPSEYASVLEREAAAVPVRTSGSPTTTAEPRAPVEAWKVRIHNDNYNSREHVTRILVEVTGISEFTSYQTMVQAAQNGMADLGGPWALEVAELYQDQITQNGISCDMIPILE